MVGKAEWRHGWQRIQFQCFQTLSLHTSARRFHTSRDTVPNVQHNLHLASNPGVIRGCWMRPNPRCVATRISKSKNRTQPPPLPRFCKAIPERRPPPACPNPHPKARRNALIPFVKAEATLCIWGHPHPHPYGPKSTMLRLQTNLGSPWTSSDRKAGGPGTRGTLPHAHSARTRGAARRAAGVGAMPAKHYPGQCPSRATIH